MASLTRTAAAVTTWEIKINPMEVFQNLQHLKLLAVEHVYFYEHYVVQQVSPTQPVSISGDLRQRDLCKIGKSKVKSIVAYTLL